MIFMHFQNSCTRNCDHHVLLIMTGNAHKESCHKLLSILKGEGIETQSQLMVATLWWLLSQLHEYLFSDKSILRYGAASFLCILAGYLYLWY